MKQDKETKKRKKDDEAKKSPAGGQNPGDGPQRIPGEPHDSGRIPGHNPNDQPSRNDEEEDENIDERRRA